MTPGVRGLGLSSVYRTEQSGALPQRRFLTPATLVAAAPTTVYVYRGNPFQRTRSYKRAQAEARTADRGLWGSC